MDTSGTPQEQESTTDRSEEVRPEERRLIRPPQKPASPSPRRPLCSHFQYGKSAMCPSSQATTNREGTRVSEHSAHSLRPGGELNLRTWSSAWHSGQWCHSGKRRTRMPSRLSSAEAGGRRNRRTPNTRARRGSWITGASSRGHCPSASSMPETMNDSCSTAINEPTPYVVMAWARRTAPRRGRVRAGAADPPLPRRRRGGGGVIGMPP